jgi:anthranilate phosphoribosyltransferase
MPITPQEALQRTIEHREIFHDEMLHLMRMIMSGEMSPVMASALITGLRVKKETIGEVTAAAQVMREFARKVVCKPGPHFVDIVGTGGDGAHTFNISTASMFVVAAAGASVAKHGNRSVSSKSGAADVLEAFGANIMLTPEQVGQCLEETGIGFMFAPNHHPAMKNVAAIRKELGVRTVFNILGPLSNPAEPPFHLIGAYHVDIAALMADTLAGMPIERAYVVHGEPGWDEATPIGPFTLFDVRPGQVKRMRRSAEEFALPPCSADDLKGGDAAYNAQHLRAVLEGLDRGPHRSAIVLQAALVLELMDKTSSAKEAARMAQDAIEAGAGRQILERIAAFGRGESAGG